MLEGIEPDWFLSFRAEWGESSPQFTLFPGWSSVADVESVSGEVTLAAGLKERFLFDNDAIGCVHCKCSKAQYGEFSFVDEVAGLRV